MNTEQRINSDRAARGLGPASPRQILIDLAIDAGRDFSQIGAMLRSGIGDGDALNGVPLAGPGSETLLDRAMRDA